MTHQLLAVAMKHFIQIFYISETKLRENLEEMFLHAVLHMHIVQFESSITQWCVTRRNTPTHIYIIYICIIFVCMCVCVCVINIESL